MLFGQEPPTSPPAPDNQPWWVVGIFGILGILYAFVRFFYYVRQRRRDDAASTRMSELEVDAVEAEQLKAARRDAVQEAWDANERLQSDVERLSNRIDKMEADHREELAKQRERTEKCEREHAETKLILGEMRGVISVVRVWAEKRGLKIPPLTGDTGIHTPLPPQEDGT